MVAPERIGSGLVPDRHKPAPPAQHPPAERAPGCFRHSILSAGYKTLRVFSS